jgi:uncharacterized membrane protein
MKKARFGKAGKDIALALLSYFRMVVVIASLVAWSEREWTGLILSLVVFGITTLLVNKALDYPTDDTIQTLIGILGIMRGEEEEN